MSAKTDEFIKVISEYAVKEYKSREKWILPSVCIAQAALESGWNLNASTLFGIKGNGFNASTSEYVNGQYVSVTASFRKYESVEKAVTGYYDFITTTPRYVNACNNTDYKDAVYRLIHTIDGKPYATSPTYITNICSIIEKYNLTIYDNRDDVTSEDIFMLSIADMKTLEEVKEVQEKVKKQYPNLVTVIRKSKIKCIECL